MRGALTQCVVLELRTARAGPAVHTYRFCNMHMGRTLHACQATPEGVNVTYHVKCLRCLDVKIESCTAASSFPQVRKKISPSLVLYGHAMELSTTLIYIAGYIRPIACRLGCQPVQKKPRLYVKMSRPSENVLGLLRRALLQPPSTSPSMTSRRGTSLHPPRSDTFPRS